MELDARILVAGRCGWVGNALLRRLWAAGFHNIQFLPADEVDLTQQASAETFLLQDRPQYVFLTAAREGADGRLSGEAVRESLAVQANVTHAAWRADVRKLCFLASSDIYPADALPPLREGPLFSAVNEPDKDLATLAQIAGIRMSQLYRRRHQLDAINVVPAELYGPGDSAGAQAGVLSALVRRVHEARMAEAPELAIDATAAQAWLQVDDFADAALFSMRGYSSEVPVNVDGGQEIAFADLARVVADVIGYRGRLVQAAASAGARHRMSKGLRLNALGWSPCMPLRQGIEQMCRWYLQSKASVPLPA